MSDLYDKGVRVREAPLGTLGENQTRLDLVSPETTPMITATAGSWSEKTLLYTVPDEYKYFIYFIIVSLHANTPSNYADFNLLLRAANGTDDDKIVGRSAFYTARSITYPAGEEFLEGDEVRLTFYNPYGSGTLTFNYFIHGVKEMQ